MGGVKRKMFVDAKHFQKKNNPKSNSLSFTLLIDELKLWESIQFIFIIFGNNNDDEYIYIYFFFSFVSFLINFWK